MLFICHINIYLTKVLLEANPDIRPGVLYQGWFEQPNYRKEVKMGERKTDDGE